MHLANLSSVVVLAAVLKAMTLNIQLKAMFTEAALALNMELEAIVSMKDMTAIIMMIIKYRRRHRDYYDDFNSD